MTFPLYAVGVGPGDPELLTLKAVRMIHAADVIIAPAGVQDAPSLAESIINNHVDPVHQQVLVRTFPMTRDAERLLVAWQKIAAEVAGLVNSGRRTVFITLGDPLVYSTFIYLYEQLQSDWPELAIEIVPGVTSFTAAAAAAGFPLVHGSGRLAVMGGDLDPARLPELLLEYETVVLLKVAKHFAALRESLRAHGLLHKTVFARRVGQTQQVIETDLDQIRDVDLDYFSLLMVRS